MVLDEVCNAKVYSANAFYVLGLPVNVNSRKIRRREEDLIDGLGSMGGNAWSAEFDKYLLGRDEAPKVEVARTLIARLKSDPEYFATEMFFWFWPQNGMNDPAIDAIVGGERDQAIRLWLKDKDRPGARGIIARHNLAVALHLYAIDGEECLLESVLSNVPKSGDGTDYSDVLESGCEEFGSSPIANRADVTEDYATVVDQYWKSSFEFWEGLSDDDAFWDVFAEMVEAINDPRLDEEFICSFRERFPVCFDDINGDFMVAYAKRKNILAAKRHFDYIVSTMSGEDDVEETMERSFKPFADKVRILIKQCDGTTKASEVLKVCRGLLKESEDFVQLLKMLVPMGNAYSKKLLNDIVAAVDNKLPLYSRETGDYDPCLSLTKQLLALAATPLMKEKIQKSIKEWEDLVRQAREENTCCVCGKFQKGMSTKPLKLYCDVSADPTMYGRVQWRTRTLQVPVCSSCSSKLGVITSLGSYAKKISIVKQSISDGWKIGEKPSQKELDAVRFL